MKKVLDFYIKSSIHVALAVLSLVQITKMQQNIFTDERLDYFIFCSTIVGYNFLKYFEAFLKKTFTLKKNFIIILTSSIAFFGMIFYFFRLEFFFQIEILKIGLLVLIYPVIRKYGFIKMAFVSCCLTLITICVFEVNYNLSYFIQRFLIIFCLLIPGEIIDIVSDSKSIVTLPQIIGTKKTKLFGYFLLLNCFLLDLYYTELKIYVIVNTFILTVIALFIFFSSGNKSKYFASFWVESIPILWLLLLLIFS